MKIKNYLIAAALLVAANTPMYAQPMQITLEQAIEISRQQSPDMLTAELKLERYEKLLSAQEASLKTQFKLKVDPIDYNKNRYLDSRLSQWYTNESFTSDGTISIEQPLIWTGATVSLNNTFGWNNNTSQIDGSSASTSRSFTNSLYLSLDQPLFTYNEMKYEFVTIALEYEDAKISYALSLLNLEQSIINHFYTVYMAQENLSIAKEEYEDATQNYNIIEEKVRLDMVPRSELFQAELNQSSAESTMVTRELTLNTVTNSFKKALGIPLITELSVIGELVDKAVAVDVKMAVEHALTNRLEMLQRDIIDKNADIALLKIKDNDSFTGDLSLSVGIMGDNQQLPNIYNSPTQNPSVNLSLNIPIFDWGARRDKIKAQKLQIDMNAVSRDQELVDIEIEVVNSCRTLSNLAKQIEISKKAVVNAQQTYDLNVELYRAGEITGMEINEFQSQLSSQKTTLSQKMVDYELELVNLKCVSLYDFEKREAIAPMLMYNPKSMREFKNYSEKKKSSK